MTSQPAWWPFPWLNFAPAQLTQPILPDFSLQRVEVNYAGNVGIEKAVVADVASYGKQLGIISEAVLALAGDVPAERGNRLDRLREIVRDIEAVKKAHASDLVDSARDAMTSLAKSDPGAATRVAAEFAKALPKKSG